MGEIVVLALASDKYNEPDVDSVAQFSGNEW